jgi:hypothetical protein
MNRPQTGSAEQPFPLTRPEMVLTPSDAAPFAVDDRRMPGFGIAPTVGAASWMSWYDPPEWRLTCASYMEVAGPAVVHGIECVEVQGLDWEAGEARWRNGFVHFVRLTDEAFEWLACSSVLRGKRVLRTFLDDGFDRDWGSVPRRIEDTGRLVGADDGTYTLEASPGDLNQIRIGAGVFNVRVGDSEFECLRAIQMESVSAPKGAALLERGILVESFHTRAGEIALWRRYNGRRWNVEKRAPCGGTPWDERLPDAARLVVNGALFVHWYDCLTDISIGMETTPGA